MTRRPVFRGPILRLAAVLACWLLVGCTDVAVLHDLPESEANRVLSVLQQHGIPASKDLDNAERNTWSVSVAKQDAGHVWPVLADYKLPRRGDRRFQDVFGQSKLVVTPLEEQALYVEALQGEIGHTLETVDGVIDARVHLVLPERDLAGRPMGRPKASVVLEYQTSSDGAAPLEETQVRSIVAHAVNDLQPDQVSVVCKAVSVEAAPDGLTSGLDMVRVGSLIFERKTLARLKIAAVAMTLFIALLGGVLLWLGQQLQRMRTSQHEVAARPRPALPAAKAREVS